MKGKQPAEANQFIFIELEDAKYLLSSVRNNILSLQDKAKVTAVAVTLAFSMVGGISGYLLNLKDNLYNNWFFLVALIVFVIASCSYLIMAGYYSLITLNSRPRYDFSPNEFEYIYLINQEAKKRRERLSMMGIQYKMTSYQNTILNNYVDCSNNNLRNALVSLGIFFTLICASFALENGTGEHEKQQVVAITEQKEMINEVKKKIEELTYNIEISQEFDKQKQQEIFLSVVELQLLVEEMLNENIREAITE